MASSLNSTNTSLGGGGGSGGGRFGQDEGPGLGAGLAPGLVDLALEEGLYQHPWGEEEEGGGRDRDINNGDSMDYVDYQYRYVLYQ